jgi:sulfur transfer protein SufE
MSTVAEIKAAIEKLPGADFGELLKWIDDYRAMLSASETLFAMHDEEEQNGAKVVSG